MSLPGQLTCRDRGVNGRSPRTLASGLGTSVGDIGCGTGRLEPYLTMIRVARRDHPGFGFGIADLRALPFEDASLAGAARPTSLSADVKRTARSVVRLLTD